VNQEKTDINAHLKVGERNEWFCNGSFYISEDDEW